MAKAKQVATRQTTAVAKTNGADDALLAQMAADAGSGFEEAGRDAYAIPFLRILQDLSPQTKKKMSGYIEGAKPGMVFNTVSKELLGPGGSGPTVVTRVIPCYFSQAQIEWIPRGDDRQQKAGFVMSHPANTPLLAKTTRNEKNRNVLPNGHELVDTRQHFVLYEKADGTWSQALLAMQSTQLKVSRRWMTQMRDTLLPINGVMIAAPSFAFSYAVKIDEEANEQGSWYVWDICDQQRVVDADTYQRAKAFCALMREGKAKVNYDDAADDVPGGSSASAGRGPAPVPGDLHDEIDA